MSARRIILPVFIPHLGCPHVCVFCNQHEITASGSPGAHDDPLTELNRILDLPPDGKERELALYGGSFTAIPVPQQLRLLEPALRARKEGIITSIRLSTRPDAIDFKTLERLKEYGVETIELGAQSMSDHVLFMSGRGHTAEDVRKAAEQIKNAGFRLVLQMMTGLPGDDDEGAMVTAQEFIRLRPDAARIYPTVVVRGTQLERLWRRGEYREHTVEDAVRVCAKILPLFDDAGIPVIRLGLNPTEELGRRAPGKDSDESRDAAMQGAALAGAYHPALGELVRSRILRNRMESLLCGQSCEGRSVVILVPERQLSQAIGQHRSNVLWLEERFHLDHLQISARLSGKETDVKLFQLTGISFSISD